MVRLRMLCVVIPALLVSASQASAQGARGSLDVFFTFLMDPAGTVTLQNNRVWEKAAGRANSEVQQPISIEPGPPPMLHHGLLTWTPRGGRGDAGVSSSLRFANYSLEPASVTVEWTAAVFLEAIAGRQTMSSADARVRFASWPGGFYVRVGSSRLQPPGLLDETRSGQVTFFVPAGELKQDGGIRPGALNERVTTRTRANSLTTVPEPISIVLLGTGVAAIGLVRRRRKVGS
jgi:hypothetical protein